MVLIWSHDCAHTNTQQGPGHKKTERFSQRVSKVCLAPDPDPTSLNLIYNGHSKKFTLSAINMETKQQDVK